MNRKDLKKQAKQNLKKHYWILVIVCLFATFLGVEFGASKWSISYDMNTSGFESVLTNLASGNDDAAREQVALIKESIRKHDTNAALGRSRGVISTILNSFSSGGIALSFSDALRSILSSKTAANVILILLSLFIYIFVWLFIKETYLIITRRIALECRTYETVPLYRFFYPIQTRKWLNMALIMFVERFYHLLWSFTIIGGIIKSYSYYLVPYIVAENPNITAKQAITLSRRMMNGHKWECFVASLSFLGWELLNLVTFGLVGIFFSNPYQCAFFAEYYATLRAQAIETNLPGSELLCDAYLYEKPSAEVVASAYNDVSAALKKIPAPVPKPTGFVGFLSGWLGILPVFSKSVQDYENREALCQQLKSGQQILSGKCYPGRLAPAAMKFKLNATTNLFATRSYTIVNLIWMFFLFSFIGWVWEVSLCFISSGGFVNRGVLQGPWLPIYGTGGVLILIVLKKLRKKPIWEFISAIVLCGCVEYSVAWNLEMTHGGQKWWDYSGYFLNLHGRICAEGLLVFGLGGLAIVYLIAPFIDNQLTKLKRKPLAIIGAILLVIFAADQLYSNKHPNMGEGITSISTGNGSSADGNSADDNAADSSSADDSAVDDSAVDDSSADEALTEALSTETTD